MNNQYQCFGTDLTTDCARKLIQELFKGQTIRRREIVSVVFEQHHERGGTNSGVHPNVIQSALKSMRESGLAANPKHGVWHITYYIKTLNEFIEWAAQFDSGENPKQYLFRGVSSADYKIDASAYRRIKKGRDGDEEQDGDFEKFLQINKDLIREARYRAHDQQDDRKLEDLEILAEFQHYGAATFLIDFTYNALVAIWFACKKSSGSGPKDGKVVAVCPDDFMFTSEIALESIKNNIDRLFLGNHEKLYKWQPRSQNNRIIAQQSIFLFGVLKIEINPAEECIIDRDSKEDIRESLRRIYGITEDMLFPDFDGFARQYSQDVPYTQLTASQYKERGVRAYQRREYTEALADFDMAIKMNSRYEEAYYWSGIVKSHQQYEAAIEDFTRAIELQPNYAEAYYQRGFTYHGKGDLERAIPDYTKAIGFQPDYTDAYYNRGIAYHEAGMYDAAIEDFTEIIELRPDSINAYYLRGVVISELGDFGEAKQNFQTALQLAQQAGNERLILEIEQGLHDINLYIGENQ